MRVRKNDTVLVISGRDRGKRGRVLSVHPETQRVVVEGAGVVKRHTKPNPQKNIKGGIVEKEAPVSLSNVMLKDPDTGKPTRLGVRAETGGRARYAKKSGTTVSTISAGTRE